MGKLLVIVGLVLVLLGTLYTYFPAALSWFGNLPGDIKINKPNSSFFFPITSMIVVSIIFSLIMRLFRYMG